ncbi:hypothetical protein BAE44_0012781 [Dichanthelium oligosanthes]|uniref:Uncharacterized protein n=1 Tax=Dichanthelium oligosanthes TaxID=888268 RepID=A0A1E5VM44_9POAL|nr:hypothetical protein BAE44_0012781 [Dichanthelium oligosanthes]
MEEEHYSIYCINFIHNRIDVLDSSPEDTRLYHELETDGIVKQFTRFKHPIIDVCVQSHANDSGFFTIKFMELWNGESFHVPVLTVSLTIHVITFNDVNFFSIYLSPASISLQTVGKRAAVQVLAPILWPLPPNEHRYEPSCWT